MSLAWRAGGASLWPGVVWLVDVGSGSCTCLPPSQFVLGYWTEVNTRSTRNMIDLEAIPVTEFESKARPSLYSYTPPLEEKKDDKREKVETAILSITAKAKKKERLRQGGTSVDGKTEKMDVEEGETETKKEEEKKETEEKESKEKPKETKEPEPNFEMLENPARVMKQQLKVVSLPAGSRYGAVKNVSLGGIIMLSDRRPTEAVEFVAAVKTGGAKKEEEEKEPEPPEVFEFKPENY